MVWIESHCDLADHPKTLRLAGFLGVDVPTAIGHLHLLWWWAMRFAKDGLLEEFSEPELAHAARWQGDSRDFVEALIRSRFVDLDPIRLHDWDQYGGKLENKRAANAERNRRARATHVQGTSASRDTHERVTSASRDALEERRVEKRRGEERTTESGAVAPADAGKVTPLPVRAVPKPRASTAVLAADWDPPAEALAWADEQGLDARFVAFETDKFKDHFLSKGEKKADWTAAWRNWLRRAGEFAAVNRAGGGGSRARAASRTDQVRGEIEELLGIVAGEGA